jgi:hypothetical protein
VRSVPEIIFKCVALNDLVEVFPLVTPDQVKVMVGATPNMKPDPVTVVKKDHHWNPECVQTPERTRCTNIATTTPPPSPPPGSVTVIQPVHSFQRDLFYSSIDSSRSVNPYDEEEIIRKNVLLNIIK